MGYIQNIKFDKLYIVLQLLWYYIYNVGLITIDDIFIGVSPWLVIMSLYHGSIYAIPIKILILLIITIILCIIAESLAYFNKKKDFVTKFCINGKEFIYSLDPYRRQKIVKMGLFIRKLDNYEPDIVNMIYKISKT